MAPFFLDKLIKLEGKKNIVESSPFRSYLQQFTGKVEDCFSVGKSLPVFSLSLPRDQIL